MGKGKWSKDTVNKKECSWFQFTSLTFPMFLDSYFGGVITKSLAVCGGLSVTCIYIKQSLALKACSMKSLPANSIPRPCLLFVGNVCDFRWSTLRYLQLFYNYCKSECGLTVLVYHFQVNFFCCIVKWITADIFKAILATCNRHSLFRIILFLDVISSICKTRL